MTGAHRRLPAMSTESSEQLLVSVVMPTYNRAHVLGHAIRSVLDQSHVNLELIVVDDHSSDQTPRLVQSIDDGRLRYVRNDANLKLPGALNKGFALSKGGYLTWTSDDNLYAPEAIAKMVAFLRAGGCDFVFADYFEFSDLDERSGKPIDARPVRLPDTQRLEERNAVGACFMYTRAVYEAVGLYDQELFLVEDYDYFIRVHKRFRIGHIAETLYYFRRHPDALFCSRFAEVKAADVLVRYKNDLLDDEGATNACVELIMRNMGGLRNPLLKNLFIFLRRTSFRLTNAYSATLKDYLRWRLGRSVAGVLEGFRSKGLTFRQSRDALLEVIQRFARLEYR